VAEKIRTLIGVAVLDPRGTIRGDGELRGGLDRA
jgi:hypothetical protein